MVRVENCSLRGDVNTATVVESIVVLRHGTVSETLDWIGRHVIEQERLCENE